MSEFHPYPWSEFPVECLWYFAGMGILHCGIFFVGCIVLAGFEALVTWIIKPPDIFFKRVQRLELFLILLLIVASIFICVWLFSLSLGPIVILIPCGGLVLGGLVTLAASNIQSTGILFRRVQRLELFLILLLIVGSIHNGLWSCLIWGRLYYSTDYLIDFSAFWPITQSVIDAEFGDGPGKLLGVSLLQLQLVWLLFASSTWIVTILLYRRICKRLSANK